MKIRTFASRALSASVIKANQNSGHTDYSRSVLLSKSYAPKRVRYKGVFLESVLIAHNWSDICLENSLQLLSKFEPKFEIFETEFIE